MRVRSVVWMVAGLASAILSGCRVENSNQGRSDEVKIATPFGGLQVRMDATVVAEVGLPVYPGAQAVKKGDGHDTGAADVDLSFGRFQLRVKALDYRTADDPAKVKAFYLKALGRYGDVIECVADRPVGGKVRTAEGLTCDKGKSGRGKPGDEFAQDIELKAGSERHQHAVPIEQEGTSTRFALIALDLPASAADPDPIGPDARQ